MGYLTIRMFLGEITKPLQSPIVIYCDNQSTIAITKNDKYHTRTKHIDLRYHFIREIYTRKIIDIQYCPTENMTADILTKPIKTPNHKNILVKLGLRSA
jgi:hypothetical protein